MPSNELKRAARAYAAEHGVKYTDALRAVQAAAEQPIGDRVRARVTVTADPDETALGRRWEIAVDDPREEKPFGDWIYPPKTQQRVDELADIHGWRRAPGVEWPVEPTTDPVVVELVRSDVGQRNDEVEKILAEAGLDFHGAPEPYMAAVGHELTRVGIGVKEAFAAGNEPRDGAIDLTVPLPGDDEMQLAWREDQGWYYLSFQRGQAADGVIDLPVGHLAEPYDVAVAFCDAIGHPVDAERPDWRPPAEYAFDAVAPDEWWDVSPALERALSCYTTYPGWTPIPRKPAPAPEPVNPHLRDVFDPDAPDVLLQDPVTGCWRAWARAQADTARDAPDVGDDGETVYGNIYIAGETFRDDGTLQLRTSRGVVGSWLKTLRAPVGSKHTAENASQCRVCHDDHEYETPTTRVMLEHRGHQIRAAYERLAGIAPGDGARVLADQDGDFLTLTLRLIDPSTRLLGMHWRSDDDWKTILQDTANPGEERTAGTLISGADWQPHRIANEMKKYVGNHR